MDLVRDGGFRMVVMLGAYLDDVIYSQPVEVNGFSADAGDASAEGTKSSSESERSALRLSATMARGRREAVCAPDLVITRGDFVS